MSLMSSFNKGVHDMGGERVDFPIEIRDKPLQYWELCIHALLVVLSKRSPPLITTDELRRSVEALEEPSYLTGGYYEKWAAAMTVILLERNVITQVELDEELMGDGNSLAADSTPKFARNDAVRVMSEDTRVRWRKPHLRCPGYIFNCKGRIEKYVGCFNDPFLLAFRGVGPPQHLYIVSFSPRDVWPEGHNAGDAHRTVSDDRLTVEIYESWLKSDSACLPSESEADQRVYFSSNRGENVVGSGDKSVLPHDHSHDHHDHHHAHSDHHGDAHSQGDHSHNDHDHGDHVHEDRVTVECRAVENETPDAPGKLVAEALLRTLYKKGVTDPASIRDTVSVLEQAGVNLFGADIVVKAWTDGAFKARLLVDACEAAKSLDIATSNPNAPTVLQVVECTPDVHHVCVCTLCSCYPSSLLGLSPSWYKSRSYRSRTIREPRKVLREFGTEIPPEVSIHVHDSTADCRYLVIPLRPAGTEGWSDEQLRSIVTRDSMIGVSVIATPTVTGEI